MMKLGNNAVDMMLGAAEVRRAFLGSTKVFQRDYGTMTALFNPSETGSQRLMRSAARNMYVVIGLTIDDVEQTLTDSYNMEAGFHEAVYTIGDSGKDVMGAFAYCDFYQVTMPDTIKEIGTMMFYMCEKLKGINLPTGLTEIGSMAFSGCTLLQNVNIPSTVTKIGAGAFDPCPALEHVYMSSTTPPQMSDGFDEDTNLTIHVPQQAVNTYKTAPGWSAYASKIVGG